MGTGFGASALGLHLGALQRQVECGGGQFQIHPFGLHDMSGNVREWTCLAYTKSYDGSEQKCAVSASKHSLRGGSWFFDPRCVRAAFCFNYGPDTRSSVVGFRLAQG